jgi:hypothetical protein
MLKFKRPSQFCVKSDSGTLLQASEYSKVKRLPFFRHPIWYELERNLILPHFSADIHMATR